MNNSKQFLNAVRVCYRQMSQSAQAETVAPRFGKLKEIQKKFQVDNGVPVHLKSGLGDKILYRLTIALTAVGVGMSVETFYHLIFGK